MKTSRQLLFWSLLLMTVTASAYLLAQSTSQDAILDRVATLLKQGDAKGAQAVIATIKKTDANHPAAMCYDALCLYALNDKKKFLRVLESPEVQGADISPQIREELEYDQLDALFFYRKFELLLPKIEAYQKNHGDSEKVNAVAEYRLAGLYERGMKKIYEAGILGNGEEFAQHWTDGQSNLVEFLNLVVALNKQNYQVLPDRELEQEIVKAMTALGDEKAVQLVPAADREKTAFLSLNLYRKLQPKAVDDNLQRMTNFLNDFPETLHRKRVLFDMADISFSTGEHLVRTAESIRLSRPHGDLKVAAQLQATGEQYLSHTWALTNQFYEDPAAGIEAQDVFDRQADWLNSYFWERDYEKLEKESTTLISNSALGSKTWRMAKTYRGIGRFAHKFVNLKGAAEDLDAVLADGFNGRVDHDHWTLAAAEWRLKTGDALGETNKAAEIVAWVKANQVCPKNQRVNFLQMWGSRAK
jgi:hypothetical protein